MAFREHPHANRNGNITTTLGTEGCKKCQCIACGMPIGWQPLHFPSPPPPFPHIVDERDPRAWLGQYRLVVTSRVSGQRCFIEITGSAFIGAHHDRHFDVPAHWGWKNTQSHHKKVVNDERMNVPLDMTHLLIAPASLLEARLNADCTIEAGYPMHERCFRLASQMFAPCFVRHYSGWFKLTMKHWQKDVFPFGLKDRLLRDCHPLSGASPCGFKRPCQRGDKYCRVNASWNCWNNPELIEDMRWCDRTLDWTPGAFTSESPEPAVSTERPFIPLELKLLILDCLSNHDAAVTVRAMGWVLPEGWCREHISADLMLQRKLTPPALEVNFDWNRFFLLETKRYTPGYRGLRNRERIMRIQEMIRPDFERLAPKKTSVLPHIYHSVVMLKKDFVNWVYPGGTRLGNSLLRELSLSWAPLKTFYDLVSSFIRSRRGRRNAVSA